MNRLLQILLEERERSVPPEIGRFLLLPMGIGVMETVLFALVDERFKLLLVLF